MSGDDGMEEEGRRKGEGEREEEGWEEGRDEQERSRDDLSPRTRSVELEGVGELGSDEVEEGFGGETAAKNTRTKKERKRW